MEFSKVHFLGLCCSYYIYIANRNFEGFSSVLNLLISHMKWIASSNEVTALDKTNIINCITNNSIPSALHICYFAPYFLRTTNSTTEENCGKGWDTPKDWHARKINIVILWYPTIIEMANLWNRIYLIISCLYIPEDGSRAPKHVVPIW